MTSPLSSEHARAVLAERAKALARPLAQQVEGDILDVVTFTLQDERYAVESRLVLEMFRVVDVVPLPGAASPVFGVTAWRGELIPVIDLRSLLGLSPVTPEPGSLLLVLGREQVLLGVPADAPGDVLAIPQAAVRPPAGLRAAEYVRGITPRAELLLDVDKILLAAGPEPV